MEFIPKDRPLHVAFFNRAFYPEVSATGQLLTELAQGLTHTHGVQVSVVAGVPLQTGNRPWKNPKGWWLMAQDQFEEISILRAHGTHFSKRRFMGRVTNYLTYFFSAYLAGLRLKRPDVIVALTDPPIIGLAALLAAWRFRCPLVISYRDLFPEVGHLLEDFNSPAVDGILTLVNRILIRYSKRLVALGEAMRNRLIEKGASPDRVVIIPDWADTSAIVPTDKKNPFSIRHGLQDRFVVMHSGNMGVSQNLEMVLEAAACLKETQDLAFVFVGEGLKKAALQAGAQRLSLENVLFLPYEPKENLSNSFAAADCFIVSLKPGLHGYIMPSKLYGILAAGRPYVASVDPECDVARITQKYRCGLLSQAGSAQDLAEKILQFYRDRTLVQTMGANARKASHAFDRSVGVKAYYDLCLKLAPTPPAN